MATSTAPISVEQFQQQGAGALPQQSDDHTPDAPSPKTKEQVDAELDQKCREALLWIRKTFKMRYQPKRMRFITGVMRAFEALRGNTYALLNDQSAALDTINQLMQGYLGQGDDPQLYAHNDNIYQAFAMIFIAALMVDLGKVRYQPADAQDDSDLKLANMASKIHAFNERKNDVATLQQLELLYLWTCGCYFTYVRYVVDSRRAGTSTRPDIQMVPKKIVPDGYLCPSCGEYTPENKASMFTSNPQCPNCGASLSQANYREGPVITLPVAVGEIEEANGMVAFDVVNGMMIDANPDAMGLEDTEILDYQIEVAPGKVRSAYPDRYDEIQPVMGADASSDGDMARMARAGQTTPGTNNRAITADGLGTYSRCWITPEAFFEYQDKLVAAELKRRYPKGCKLVLWGEDLILDTKPEALLERWTWCGTVKGLGLYPFAAGAVVLDVQERVTGAVNKIDAYMDRVAYGTMLYDADVIDGTAMQNKVLTPGNLTPVNRTDDETGQRVPLPELMFQPTFHIDAEIYKYPDQLTMRAQFLCGVMPQVFGGSDKNVETAAGQEQALNTALGRLKQYIKRMRAEKADRARLSVCCSIENMDEEIRIVEQGDTQGNWQTIRLLKAELTGDFFTYPETDEEFPASFEEVRQRLMTLLADNQKMPFVAQLLSDPDVAAVVAHYLLPPGIELTGEPERAKVKEMINALSQDKRGPLMQPDPTNPQNQVPIPSIMPDFTVDDPGTVQTLAKKWLQTNWKQAETNPPGYDNVLALLKVAAQQNAAQQAKQAIMLQQAKGQRQL